MAAPDERMPDISLHAKHILGNSDDPNSVDALIYGDTEISVTAQRVPVDGDAPSTLERRKIRSYYTFTNKIGFSSYIVCLMGLYRNKYVLTEPYTHTLHHVIQSHGMRFWIQTPQGLMMTPLLQGIIKNIIDGLYYLAKDDYKVDYELTKHSVKFNNQGSIPLKKREMLSARLGDIWDKEGGRYEESILWKRLGALVEDIIQSTAYAEVHMEVREFQYMLDTHCKGNIASTIIKHPALLTRREKLDYIVEIRHMLHVETPFHFHHDNDFDSPMDWMSRIEKESRLKAVYAAQRNRQSRYTRDIQGLVCFVHDCKEHVDDMTYQYRFGGRVGLENLEAMFSWIFPRFTSFLFKCHVVDEQQGKIIQQKDDAEHLL